MVQSGLADILSISFMRILFFVILTSLVVAISSMRLGGAPDWTIKSEIICYGVS